MTFTAIDFETANGYHPCSVGIVTVENGVIVDEFVTLIKPHNNFYSPFTIKVHGIYPKDTINAKSFPQIFPDRNEKQQLLGQVRLDRMELTPVRPIHLFRSTHRSPCDLCSTYRNHPQPPMRREPRHL